MTNPIHLAIQVAEDPLFGQGKKRVIDRSFIVEEKMAGCWRMIEIFRTGFGKEDSTYARGIAE
jgi:hypothetical protein